MRRLIHLISYPATAVCSAYGYSLYKHKLHHNEYLDI
jgi:hypothetical protein